MQYIRFHESSTVVADFPVASAEKPMATEK
jgi:hypothetical protein